MEPPKAWFKLVNPESAWDKVSLEEVDDVTDLKEAIKKKASPDLDALLHEPTRSQGLKGVQRCEPRNGSRCRRYTSFHSQGL